MLDLMQCLHWDQQVVPRHTTLKFTMATHMFTLHSSFHSFRTMLWAIHIICPLMQPRLQPSWAFCMVATLKGVPVLEAIQEWQEAQYMEQLGELG